MNHRVSQPDPTPHPFRANWSLVEWLWLARVQRALPLRSETGFPLLKALFRRFNRDPLRWRDQVERFLDRHVDELDDLRQEISDLLDFADVERDCEFWCHVVCGLRRSVVEGNVGVGDCSQLVDVVDSLAKDRLIILR